MYWEWPELLRRLVISVEHSSKPEDGCKTLEERKGEKVLEGMEHPSFSKVKPLQRNSQHKSPRGPGGWAGGGHSPTDSETYSSVACAIQDHVKITAFHLIADTYSYTTHKMLSLVSDWEIYC